MLKPYSSKYLEPKTTESNDNHAFLMMYSSPNQRMNSFPRERDQLDMKDIDFKVNQVVKRLKQLD